ncbi:sensor histidine kinase [Cloacibacillus sp. An23]|uniref:sensor histidine kinase n=1 Tax=Cloacibacillus sp. An23 TaxID=1965591 RepID=UPI000B3A906B|nr:sensor histidine kinase [Cloacibacillus sp. An23]OUO91604.1 hypothetical protein B5F39_12745 [Cloacibacillus sp. An23]
MFRRISLESLMKWIFLLIALSTAVLILGTRLYQSYAQKRESAAASAERLVRLLDMYDINYSEAVILEELGPYWRRCAAGEPPSLTVESGGRYYGFVPAPEAIYSDMVEEERYLILVGILGLIVAVELAVFLSYILTRPLRRLTRMCREIADGKPVRAPLALLSPSEFYELTASFNDMSAQLERWREVQRQLSRMDRLAALGAMISSLSHEIRNPLASMRIQADLLRDGIERFASGDFSGEDIGDAEEQIKVLGEEIDRLNNIVVQLLSFVRPRPAVLTPTKLDALLPWAGSMLGAQARKHGVRLTLKSTEPDVTVMADGESLRQIVMNLALNSIQAMEEGGGSLTVSVGLSPPSAGGGERGVITVADTGGGIPSGIEHRIFDPFFTTRKDGTGLGLSIVQRITENLGGELSLENSGGGAVFRIYFKLAERRMEQ